MRLLTRKTLLYTPMIVDTTILYSVHVDGYLRFDEIERPLAMQTGGSDPALLARAAEVVEKYKYDEVDINCGCPSERVNGVRVCVCEHVCGCTVCEVQLTHVSMPFPETKQEDVCVWGQFDA